jgi:hypothetical protein
MLHHGARAIDARLPEFRRGRRRRRLSGAMNPITAVLAIALALSGLALAGCSEKGQRLSPEPGQGYNGQGAERPLRERTLQQGASARANY